MVVQPKIRGFICTAAHPDGCTQSLQNQINWLQQQEPVSMAGTPPKNVLVIGSSTGYGLSTLITLKFGPWHTQTPCNTLGVCYERPAVGEKRTASAGWYNMVAFEKKAAQVGGIHLTINGDAFSTPLKDEVVDKIKHQLPGKIDLVIYSLAAPRRTHPETGEVFQSVLKPIGESFKSMTLDPFKRTLYPIELPPATDAEIAATVAVMGGDDWKRWIDRLLAEDCLAQGCQTLAYNYIGPTMTHPIYLNGTIGQAKKDLLATAHQLNQQLSDACDGRALLSVNKALVTQASAAIPVVPLYISILYAVMKKKGLHEGCIEQMYRLLFEKLYAYKTPDVDQTGQIRMDDYEMREDIQAEVQRRWESIQSDNLDQLADIDGYISEFLALFGFGFEQIHYDRDVAIDVPIPSLA